MKSWMCRGGAACALVILVYTLGSAPDTGTLRVELDAPAMVCITSLADGKWRTPPDGRVVPPFTNTRQFYDPPPWKPGDIGPVRLTNGEYHNNETRSFIYEGGPALLYWQEVAAYFVPGGFSISLPPGKWRLAAMRGVEYLPVFEEFEIRAGETRVRKLALQRWVNMPKRGWYSGDDHVHHPRMRPEHDELLITWARAEDIHVMNILRMGDQRKTYFEQAGYGKDHRYQKGDYALVSGQEDPRTDIGEQGHAIALNITAPVRDTSRYHLYDFMFDGMREQGAITGYAHKSWAPAFYRRLDPGKHATWDSTINVIRGKIDFFEILQFRRIGLDDYYDFLNMGQKLTASAGSDLPWGNTAGEARVYACTGSHFSVDEWFRALKQGRTFVTNGPMLELTVNGALPGEEVNIKPGGSVRIRARAWAPPEIGSPKVLEVIAHGRVIRAAESKTPAKKELELDFSLRAEQGQWIAARVTSHNGALAHTSPIYVLTGGGDFRDHAELPELVDKRLRVLDYIEAKLRDQKFTVTYAAGEVAALGERVRQARGLYQDLRRTR
jgi:hypothetical protein